MTIEGISEETVLAMARATYEPYRKRHNELFPSNTVPRFNDLKDGKGKELVIAQVQAAIQALLASGEVVRRADVEELRNQIDIECGKLIGDGYNYTSGEEYGMRRAAIMLDKLLSKFTTNHATKGETE